MPPQIVDINALRSERATLVEQGRAIINTAEERTEAERNLTAEESQTWDRIDGQVRSLTERITREEQQRDRERDMLTVDAETRKPEGTTEQRVEEYRDAFESYVRRGAPEMTLEQRAVLAEGRAQAVGTDSAGGYLVPEGFYNRIVESMKAFGGMVDAAPTTRIPTADGRDLPIPTDDDTGNKGAILAENAAITEQDIVVGVVTLKAYKYTSKLVKVPYELLQDSAFPLDPYLAKKFGTRLARILNEHFTTGDNTAKPQGVVVASSLGKTAASGTTIADTELVDLLHSVDPAYRGPSSAYMFNDATLAVIKKLKDSQGRFIWAPGLTTGEPDRLLGQKYIVNQDMASIGLSAKTVLYGDFAQYFIREVKGLAVVRLSERYADNLQVGFFAWGRWDGRLVDAGTDPIKHLIQAAA